jgi:adenylate kinase family enzyme
VNGNQYEENSKLSKLLVDLPPVIIGIDGLSGSGKTSYGRFLSYFYNVTLIESDAFVTGCILKQEYDFECIKRSINERLRHQRPVIIEGICIVDLLSKMDMKPNYLIRVVNQKQYENETFDRHVQDYEQRVKKDFTRMVVEHQ